MSALGIAGGAGLGANVALSAALELGLNSVLIRPYRAIVPTPLDSKSFPTDPIQADAVAEEAEDSSLTVTEHPVEQGSKITDHAYLEPRVVRLRYGWSPGSLSRVPDPTFLRKLYEKLRSLQATRTLFTLYTGKAVYQNMILQRLSQTTTKETENALVISAVCREIIIASTTIVSQADLNRTADPASYSAAVSQGPQSLGKSVVMEVPF